ncbi:MAG TPA: PAS domain-containing protein [Sphaerochaeta sp.]|nr:PAS domain-containing protein [Sphaerochaeta sp.]
MQKKNERVDRLIEYIELLAEGPVSPKTFEAYRSAVEAATAVEVNTALEHLIAQAEDIPATEIPVARFIRSVGKSLEAQPLPSYDPASLIGELSKENEAIAEELLRLQEVGKALGRTAELIPLIEAVDSFDLLEHHYVRLQNELFPLFEAASEEHSCVKLMWSLQDDVLAARKAVLVHDGVDRADFWRLYGRYYVLAGLLSFRETYILYPVVAQVVPAEDQRATAVGTGFVSSTGTLSNEELERIFQHLPFDIAFINSEDRVAYYSDPPHRIFPRSPQVIGRLVQNCHPPKSVGTVEEILRSFKAGESSEAEFYLTLKGRFIHIQYFAVRSEDGTYLGTMEVSMDATHLRSLVGEKRLL